MTLLFNLALFLALGFLLYAFHVMQTFNGAMSGTGLSIRFHEALKLAAGDMVELKDYVLSIIRRR